MAQCIQSDSARQQLEEAVRQGEHLQLQRRLGIDEPPDMLAQVKTRGEPRPPAKLWELAVSGYEQGLLTVDRIAGAMFRTPQAIQDKFDELGIEQAPDEPDF